MMHRWQCTGRIRRGQLVMPAPHRANRHGSRVSSLSLSLLCNPVPVSACRPAAVTRAFCSVTQRSQTESTSEIAGLSSAVFYHDNRSLGLFRVSRVRDRSRTGQSTHRGERMFRAGWKFANESPVRRTDFTLRCATLCEYVTFAGIMAWISRVDAASWCMHRFISIAWHHGGSDSPLIPLVAEIAY